MTTSKHSYSREYKVWQRIKTFCYNKNSPCYKKYGANGVVLCRQWFEYFEAFLEDMGTMPEDCNGVKLADGYKEFSKLTCTWSKKSCGRPPSKKPQKTVKKDSKKLGFKSPKSICLVLEKEHLDFIKSQALQRSISNGVPVETNQLIREALQRAFPVPSQFDMFGKKK